VDENRNVQKLIADISRHGLSRRAVLKRAVALGLSAPAISVVLAACGGDDDDDDAPTATSASSGGAATEPAAATEAPEEEEEEESPEAGETPEAEATEGSEEPEETEEPVVVATQPTTSYVDVFANGKKGGRLRVAAIGEPATIDLHQTTAGVTSELAYCLGETLFSYDYYVQPQPLLAESYDVSDDGTVHTITLRQGITFHNGEPMTSADVIASVERWGRLSGVGKNLMAATTSIEATDDHTVVWTTNKPYGTITIALANNSQGAIIMPKSVLDANSDEPLPSEAMIGTGPYRLVEHQPDVHALFERFEDYVPIEGAATGSHSGHRYQWLDEIEFIPVPDESARSAGMQAGDYHIGHTIGNDHYEVLSASSNLSVLIQEPTQWDVYFLNWESAVWKELKVRQAFQACLDHMPILQNSRGGGDFVRLDPSLMMAPSAFYSTAGEELYNINNQDLARQLLEEGGYDGTPIRFMCTQEYAYMYGAAIIAQQQMEAVGFVIDMRITDWATVLENRAKKDAWDVFVTGHGFVPDPTQITYIGQMNIYPGWWSDPQALELAAQLASETDFETRYEIYEQIQQLAYETVPAIKTGDSSVIAVWASTVGGQEGLERATPYWNIWLDE
jgi:peptide/nickel transport system substrate-binding protein